MKLKTDKRTVIFVEDSDLEKFISEVYGLDDVYLRGMCEWGDDADHAFDVDKDQNPDDWQFEYEEGDWFNLDDVLNDLCDKGLIEAGEYIVRAY